MKQKVTDLLIKTSILTCIIFLISCGKNTNNGDDNSASSNKVKLAFVHSLLILQVRTTTNIGRLFKQIDLCSYTIWLCLK